MTPADAISRMHYLIDGFLHGEGDMLNDPIGMHETLTELASVAPLVLEAAIEAERQRDPLARMACFIDRFSSRMCDRGTKGCVVDHVRAHTKEKR